MKIEHENRLKQLVEYRKEYYRIRKNGRSNF